MTRHYYTVLTKGIVLKMADGLIKNIRYIINKGLKIVTLLVFRMSCQNTVRSLRIEAILIWQ